MRVVLGPEWGLEWAWAGAGIPAHCVTPARDLPGCVTSRIPQDPGASGASEAPACLHPALQPPFTAPSAPLQRPDGVPVHLKRGLPDQMLYRTTLALTVGGTLYCLVALYMASQPRSK